MHVPIWIVGPVTLVTVLAVLTDVRTRRIPNLLTGSALVLGLAAHLTMRGVPGLSDAALGTAAAAGVMLPGWLLGWKGGGDVKLMAAVGAWLGLAQGLAAALAALMAGGLIALVIAARRGVLRRSLAGAAWLGAWALSGARRGTSSPPVSGVRFPFALAVLIGAWAAFWVPLR